MSSSKSKSRRRKTSGSTAVKTADTATVSVMQKPETVSPVPNEVNQLLNQLVNECLKISLDVATEECDCTFYERAKNIAKIVKQLYEMGRR